MASTFPGTLDNFTDPLTTSPLNSPSHAGQHQDLNDAVEKIEQYMGLVKVIPTGATNGTVSATGTVTIGNAVSSVTVSGAFSSLYDNYRVMINNVDASADGVGLRFSLGSTNTGYYGSFLYDLYTGGENAYSRANNGAYQIICLTGPSDDIFLAFDVFGPNLAKPTAYNGMIWGGSYAGWFAGKQTATTQFTAFTLTPSSGTLTGGTIRVYGYRN